MSRTISEYDDYNAGDSISFTFNIHSDDIEDLTGVDAEWWLLPERMNEEEWDSEAILTHEDSGVSIDVDVDGMSVTLSIERETTQGMGANDYYQVLRLNGWSQGRETYSGRFPIQRP